ncbi:MAG: DUF3617 domain-containing protein [Gammaproteobacteria bacterium]
MKNHSLATILWVLALSVVAAAPAFAKPAVNPFFVPGLWRLHVVTYGSGKSVMNRISKTLCLLHQPRTMKPHGKMAAMCHVTSHHMVGDTLTWITACHSASLDMVSQGRAVYHKTTLDEWVNGHMRSPEKTSYRVHVTGRRIGNCPAAKSGH